MRAPKNAGDGTFENETPPSRPPVRTAARPRLSLAEVRKQLRAFLKDAKTLKTNAKLGNPADNGPFVDAFQAALAKANPLASAYADALGTYVAPRARSVDEARKELQTFTEDAEALRDWVDPKKPSRQPFADAYRAAREKAKAAAARYTVLAR